MYSGHIGKAHAFSGEKGLNNEQMVQTHTHTHTKKDKHYFYKTSDLISERSMYRYIYVGCKKIVSAQHCLSKHEH